MKNVRSNFPQLFLAKFSSLPCALLVYCVTVVTHAEVHISGATDRGDKVTLYIDYNSYGAGDIYQGAILTLTTSDGDALSVRFDQPFNAEGINTQGAVSERAVDLVYMQGQWHLLTVFKAQWDAQVASMQLLRYFGPHPDSAVSVVDKADKNTNASNGPYAFNRWVINWPALGIENLILENLSGRGVPGDQWELADLPIPDDERPMKPGSE